jgi:multiple sugar transport system substrate-binding protein
MASYSLPGPALMGCAPSHPRKNMTDKRLLNRLFTFWRLLLSLLTLALQPHVFAQKIDWTKELKNWNGKTLRVIMIQDPWVKAFDTIDQEFEKLTGAKVTIESFGYDDTHQKEVLLGSSKSDAYDIVVLDSPWVGEFAQGGFVDNLKERIDADAQVIAWNDFVPSFCQVATWKGQIIAIPFGAYFVLWNYRSDLFQQAGLSKPVTLDDYRNAAKVFTKNKKFPGIYGAALCNQRGAPVGQAYFEYIYNFGGKPFASLYPGSPDPYADMTPLLNSPESIAVVQFFKDMLAYEPPGAVNMAWDQRANSFATGRVAEVNEWSVRQLFYDDPNRSQVTGKYDTTIFPHKEGVQPCPPLGGWVMGINTYPKQKDLAWDYIKWFTSQETHKKFVLQGGPPSRLSTMQDAEVLAKLPWVKTVYETQSKTFADCRPRIPESFQIIDTVGLRISEALEGKVSIEAAMNQANSEITALLKSKGYKMGQAP